MSSLRQRYEQEVRTLAERRARLAEEGRTPEEIGRTLHRERRELALRYKQQTPLPLRIRIYQRNIDLYGDPLGPSIAWLRSRGKTWEQIAESASRPGGEDLGF